MSSNRQMEYRLKFSSNKDEVKSFASSISKLGSLLTGLTKMVSNVTKLTDQYETSQQVLNHTFDEGTKSINAYVNKLSDMVGVNKTAVSQAISLFGQMGTSLGMSTELAGEFAEKLTDLSARISIMYNQDITRASKAILGAVKGEVRTLASITGIVVKSQAQQNLLDQLGINAKVSDLNGANQALLKYLLISKQIMESDKLMGEYAESVAYQKKVLTNQVKNLTQAFGNMLYPVLKAILPVINGIAMALANLMNFFAGLFGYTESDSTAIKTKTNDIIALGDGIAKSSEKARKGLRGFDKLNNITTSTSDTSGINAGVNSKLLEQMREMDDKMLNIRMKATEISEAIMKWLGFEKDIDTGKWKFVNVTFGTILGTLIGSGGLILAISKVVKGIKNVKNAFSGITNLGKATKLMESSKTFAKSSSGFKLPDYKTILKGLGELTLIIGALGAIVLAVGALTRINGFSDLMGDGINQLVTLFKGLGEIMIPLAVLSANIALLGLAGFATVGQGLLAFAGIIATITLVTAGLGAWVQDENLKRLIDGGLDELKVLFLGLGEAFGALVGGFGAGISEGLPVIGTNLSKFAENAKSFFEISTTFSSDTALGVKYLAEALLSLTAGNVLEGITNFFTKGFVGKSSLTKFGQELERFAPHFKKYANTIDGVDGDTVKASAEAGKSLTEFAKNTPKLGGWEQKIFGQNKSLSDFGQELEAFAPHFASYATAIKGINTDIVTNSANAGKSLAELANSLPNDNGWWQKLFGSQNLSTFGEQLASFGKSFASYATSIDSVSMDKVDIVSSAIKKLVDLGITIKDKGLTNVMKDFASSLEKSGNPFSKFFSATSGWNMGWTFGNNIASGISSALKNYKYPNVKLMDGTGFGATTLKSFPIQVKGDGGFVDSGELYIARENGISEMIGRIGSHTAVANNDQIVEAVASGVARANKATQKDTDITIVAEGDTSGLLDFITFKKKEQARQFGC